MRIYASDFDALREELEEDIREITDLIFALEQKRDKLKARLAEMAELEEPEEEDDDDEY